MTQNAVTRYLSTLPDAHQAALGKLRAALRELLPDAEETISYGMPAFKISGKAIAGYAGFKAHMSYFPHSSVVIAELADVLDAAGLDHSKGGVRFTLDAPLPETILRQLVATRLKECGLDQRVA